MQFSILDLQRKLNVSWPACIGNSAESAGEVLARLIAPRRAERNERVVYLGSARIRLINMAVKYIEKLRAEIDNSLLTEESGLLSQREVFIAAAKTPSSGQGARFVAKSKRSGLRKSCRVPERRGHGVEIGLVRFGYTRNDVHTSSSGEMTAAKPD